MANKMPIVTQLEDLSNEIFLDIFEYLDTDDLFFAFGSLNSRISLLLNSIPLHVNIHSTHCHHELEFLSNHLKLRSSQVLSLQVHDKICDQENVIAYLFHRHDFLNLHSCIFHSISSSSELKIVYEKLSKLPKIVLFRIIQSCNVEEDKLNTSDASEFSQLILIDTPETLRLTTLYFHYNHSQIATTSIVTTNLTHLQIIFYGTLNDVSIYSLIPLLRIHRALRNLSVTIKSTDVAKHTSINVPNLPFINENDLPISSSLKSFDLQIVMARCDIHSIGLILHCMPNLHQFVFTLTVDENISRVIMDLTDGQNWQDMLTIRVPYLKKFDFHISVLKSGAPVDLNRIFNSFKCLINLYHQWDMCISRWDYWPRIVFFRMEHIHLWTVNYNHLITRREYDIPSITMSDTFYMQSTNISNLNDHQRNFHHHQMDFFMPKENTALLPVQPPCILPFKNIKYIVCHVAYPTPPMIAFLENAMIRLKRILSLSMKDDDDSQKYLDNLSHLVDLSNIDTVQFSRNNDITRLHLIEHVLLACPNVTTLIIDSSLLFSSKVLDNSALTLTFNQLNKIRITDDMNIPCKYASRFVQRFPSLTIVEMEVYSIGISVPIIDSLLSELAKLRLIVVKFKHDSLLDDLFSRNYVINKRRQSFGLNKDNEDKVVVKIEDQALLIRVV